MFQMFPTLLEDKNLQIQKVQQTPKRKNRKNIILGISQSKNHIGGGQKKIGQPENT